MVTTRLDIAIGQLYRIRFSPEDEPVVLEFVKEMRDGRLLFVREETGKEFPIEEAEFERMRCTPGEAVRLVLNGDGSVPTGQDIDPSTMLDPDDPSITLRERDKRLRKMEKLQRARTLKFYLDLYDKDPLVGRSHRSVEAFVHRNLVLAAERGFHWKPSTGSILRAVTKKGVMGERPLLAFFERQPKNDRVSRWPKDIVEIADEAIDYFWSDRAVTIGDAVSQFVDKAAALKEKRHARRPVTDTDPFPIPTNETIRLWIRAKANRWNWETKFGKKDADRRFRGRGRTLEATRPLEYVLMDHTQTDVWAVVANDDGEPLFVARAWLTLAIDSYSRMVLGAVLSYDKPSVHTAMACLRQVVRRKDFLVAEYGFKKGATDGWGRPDTVIVDNGWEFTGVSFQTSCEAAGINVIWAPVKAPTFKPIVERMFGTLNTAVWHKLPGGIPLTPRDRSLLGLKPEAKAIYSRDQLERAMWNALVTIYHLDVHSGIDMAPAQKWRQGIAVHSRPTVNDVSLLDKMLGRSRNCLLTAEGIAIEGQRFHDPGVTTTLMNRLARFGKARRQRRGVTSTLSVIVLVTYDPGDISKCFVWDHTTRTLVELPNWNPLFAGGLSEKAAKEIAAFAKARNLAFRSDAEKAAARVAHRAFLMQLIPREKVRSTSRKASIIEPTRDLVPGEEVEIRVMGPHPDDHAVEHDVGIARTVEEPFAVRGHRRGGAKATEKAIASRKRNKAEKEAAASPGPVRSTPAVPAAPPPGTVATEAETAALMAMIHAKVKGTKQ